MNNKHVFVYWVLESRRDLRSIYVGCIHFKKLMGFWKIFEFIYFQAQEQEMWFVKGNMGQCNFKKHFEFNSFREIFYCSSIRLRNTNLGVFIQCQYTRTISRKKNIGRRLFKKHSKFLNFNEIFYSCITRLRNMILNYCGLRCYLKVINRKRVVRQRLFKNHLKFWNFNIQ